MKRRWTIQIVPEDGGATRNFRISRKLVAALTVLTLMVAGGLVVWLTLFAGDVARSVQVTQLRERNRQLGSALQEVERRTGTLSRALDQLSAREERFRLLAGLPLIDPEVRQVGIGGPGSEDGIDPTVQISDELDRLFRRTELLSSSISEATDSLRVHRDVFLSRPSIRPVSRSSSWISSSYSRSRYHPILAKNRPHTGIDISARPESPIMSAAQGTVTFSGFRPGYGKMVEIDHGYGYRTRYAHAARIDVRRGQEVERGEVVGRVGETGLTTGPNLHYEVLVNGRPVDPQRFFLNERLFQ